MNVPTPLAGLLAIVTLAGCNSITVNDSGTIFPFDDTAATTVSEFCQESLDTTAPPGPACLQDTIACGETVTGTTQGGASLWDKDFHQSNFCFVAGTDYDGAERMWGFHQAAYTETVVTLDHCSDAALSVMSWADPETCPEAGGTVNRCEGSNLSNQVTFYTDRDQYWVIGVDTAAGDEGNFSLTVACD